MSSACGNIAKPGARHVHVLSLNLLTSFESPLILNLGLPMNRYTFVLPSENQNAFRLLSICANAVYSSIKFFCKDIHESLKYVDELSELKKNDEIQKEHASLSLSTCRSIESTQSVVQKPMRTIKWVFSISQ